MRKVDVALALIAAALFLPGVVLTAIDLFPLPPQVDFAAYYLGARALQAGDNPYDPDVLARMAASAGIGSYTPYIYPPLLAVLIRPLASLPYPAASTIWLAASIAALICSLVLLRSLVTISDRAFTAALAATLALPPVHHTLELGQINNFLLVLIVGAAVSLRSSVGGALLGLAAAIKIFPAAIGSVFVFRRDTRAIAAAVAGGIVATAISVISPTSHRALAEWVHHIAPEITAERLITPNNQSIAAVSARLFSTHRFEGMALGDRGPQAITVRPLIDRPALAPIVSTSVSALIGALTIASLWLGSGVPQRNLLALQFGAVMAALLMMLPVVWDHYYVLLLVPIAALAAGASRSAARLALIGVVLVLAHRYWRLTIYAGSAVFVSAGLGGVAAIWAAVILQLMGPKRPSLRTVSEP